MLISLGAEGVFSRMAVLLLKTILVIAGTLTALGVVNAAPITVPNGDFSQISNNGSIDALSQPNTTAVIGQGPWQGTRRAIGGSSSVSLTIGGGQATISGVTGLNNQEFSGSDGFFFQNLNGVTYQPNTTYTLSSDIDVSRALRFDDVTTAGIGISLTSDGFFVASNATVGSPGTTLMLLGNTDYRLSFRYTTGAVAPGGVLGIQLSDTPSPSSSLIFPNVKFDNVTLDAIPIAPATPEPAASALVGLGVAGLLALYRRNCRAQS